MQNVVGCFTTETRRGPLGSWADHVMRVRGPALAGTRAGHPHPRLLPLFEWMVKDAASDFGLPDSSGRRGVSAGSTTCRAFAIEDDGEHARP